MSNSTGNTGPTVVANRSDKQDPKGPEVAYRVRPKVIRSTGTDKLQRLIDYLLAANDQKFTGYIKVNFTQGSIGRIERFEEILNKF